MHVCFRAHDREAVRAFHAAAIAAGGSDDGAPGPRPIYHRDYYAAFVIDPDGHRIEAVCHTPRAPDETDSEPANHPRANSRERDDIAGGIYSDGFAWPVIRGARLGKPLTRLS